MICRNLECQYHKDGVLCPACDFCGGYMEIENNISIAKERAIIETTNADVFEFCNNSTIGSHKCSVLTRFGWCCDLCLEPELLMLNNGGVHTVNSCCGHGNSSLSSIMVIGAESIKKMRLAGYALAEIQACVENYAHPTACFVPKTKFLYQLNNRKEANHD